MGVVASCPAVAYKSVDTAIRHHNLTQIPEASTINLCCIALNRTEIGYRVDRTPSALALHGSVANTEYKNSRIGETALAILYNIAELLLIVGEVALTWCHRIETILQNDEIVTKLFIYLLVGGYARSKNCLSAITTHREVVDHNTTATLE